MTTTAQGTRMRCDQAGCNDIATVEKDAWAFCAAHAGGATAPVGATNTARPDLSRAHAAPTITMPSGPGAIGLLLEQASGHSSKRVRGLAGRIETHLEQLRQVIADTAEAETRKQAETAAKEKARADVVRLEQQLAAAKAALRGKPAKPATGRPQWTGEPIPCPKGCGRTSPNVQGAKAHERHCKAAS